MFRFQSGARMSLGPDKRARVPGRLLLFRNTSALKTTEIPPWFAGLQLVTFSSKAFSGCSGPPGL